MDGDTQLNLDPKRSSWESFSFYTVALTVLLPMTIQNYHFLKLTLQFAILTYYVCLQNILIVLLLAMILTWMSQAILMFDLVIDIIASEEAFVITTKLSSIY